MVEEETVCVRWSWPSPAPHLTHTHTVRKGRRLLHEPVRATRSLPQTDVPAREKEREEKPESQQVIKMSLGRTQMGI